MSRRQGHPGLVAGLLGCILGTIGIFAFGFVFVPLAALCALIGLLRGLTGFSFAGIGTSLLAACLCAVEGLQHRRSYGQWLGACWRQMR